VTTIRLIGRIFLFAVLASACHHDVAQRVVLKDGVFWVCDPERTMTLRTLPDGKFGLIAAVVDSAHLGSLLQNVLPPMPGPRVLMVDFAPERTGALQWAVPLVEAEGYVAYKADARCAFRREATSTRISAVPLAHE